MRASLDALFAEETVHHQEQPFEVGRYTTHAVPGFRFVLDVMGVAEPIILCDPDEFRAVGTAEVRP
ncbi:MAG: hypothetical protein Q8S13_13165 [Dehalococcoidia bacterium]|nr:hypothetical protein [Dehalococcoidia bacterium]